MKMKVAFGATNAEVCGSLGFICVGVQLECRDSENISKEPETTVIKH